MNARKFQGDDRDVGIASRCRAGLSGYTELRLQDRILMVTLAPLKRHLQRCSNHAIGLTHKTLGYIYRVSTSHHTECDTS